MKKTLLLLLALCFSLITSATLPLGRSFVHITSETGLSQSNVKAILQDSYGFMWFGTKNGLNRYDGQRVVQFRCEDPARKRGNQNISALFEDDRRTLWVGTDEGVFLYDPVADSFSFLDAQTEQGEGITGWISTIAKDMEGTVWICAPGQGVFRFDGKKLNKPSGFDNAAQPHHLCVCPNGEVYAVAWYAGLFKYDRSTGRFAQITKDVAGRTLLGLEVNTLSPLDDYLVMSLQNGNLKRYDTRRNLLEDIASPDLSHTFTRFASVLDGDIYAGTYDGLYVVDGKTGAVRHFRQEAADPSGLSDNIVYSAYRDREGGLWIGTMYGGVNYQPRTQFSFRNFRPDDTTCPLSSKRIRELAEDGRGNLWIGTEDAGLDVMTIDGSKVAHYPLPLARSKTPVTIVVASFGGKTYCSLYKEGLVVIDEKGKADFYPYSELGVGGTGCSIYALHMDREGTLWAGSDFGVFRAPKGSLKFSAVPELEGQWIFDIMQEKDGTLWFASMGKGAWKYNPKNHSFKHYVHEVDKPNSLSSNSVSSVMQDSKGRVWLSTDRGGLCRYNQKEDNFTRLSVEEGMPDDVAYKVLEDSLGFLWFGTNRGLVRFNPETEDVRVFTVHDGLCGNQFNYKSAVKGSDGNFYFGSIEGLVCFNPDIRKEPTDVPPIYITRFSVFNEEVTVHSPESPLEQSIIGTKEIVLPHDRANMSFDIALLSYSTQQANEYYYKLEPVDKQWIRTRTENSISYANLPPGNYVLHLRATTDAGMEDTQYASRSLAITILPPWYASVWAYIAYAILAACAFGIWFLWYRRHKNKQFSERQKLFEIEK